MQSLNEVPARTFRTFSPTGTGSGGGTGRSRALLLFLALLGGFSPVSAGQSAPSRAIEVRALLQRGKTALKANDVDGATKFFRSALALEPGNADAHSHLGVIEFLHGDCQRSSQDFRQALAVQPGLSEAKAMLGICGRRLGDRAARTWLESSFPKLTDPALRTRTGMELAGIYYEEGDPERSVSVLQKLVELNPDNVDILYMAQRLYGELADDTLNKLAVLAPASARMQQVIAEHSVNAGDVKGAIRHYRMALEIGPRLPGVRFELAEAILESSPGDAAAQADAEKELAMVVATEGNSAKVQCEFGRIALLRSDLQGAHDHYLQAFTLTPKDTRAQLGLGRILMSMQRPQDARKYLEMAVESDPLNSEAHYRLALAYKDLQMVDKAEKEMHLFQEIKKTKDQVRTLYRQMNQQPKPDNDEMPVHDQ
jgi:tetratricopeptide (TPR) repeat protein